MLLTPRTQIAYNDGLVVWQDSFSRPNRDRIRRRWEEFEQDGIEIFVRQHQVVFAGQNIVGHIHGSLLRSIRPETFVAISADFFTGEKTDQAYSGILLTTSAYPKGPALYFAKTPGNVLAYALTHDAVFPNGTKFPLTANLANGRSPCLPKWH